MINLPSLRQLQYLLALAQVLHFGRAAQACFVSQSTLSAGIRELEATLGVDLVERGSTRVTMTPVGAEVARRAAEVVAAAQDLTQLARTAGKPFALPLNLGAIPTIAPFLLPRVLARLRDLAPQARVFLREEQTVPLLAAVEAGEVDFAVIATPWETGTLHVEEVGRDELWFVARQDDVMARTKEVHLRDVDVERLMFLEDGHCLRDHALAACGTRVLRRRERLEASSLYTLTQMVENGLGVTLVPEIAIKAGALNGTTLVARPIGPKPPGRAIALVARSARSRLEEFAQIALLLKDTLATKLSKSERARAAGKWQIR
jgi:LysR family transcriptional regulator, hydrogen peroxide-inducible genes activator